MNPSTHRVTRSCQLAIGALLLILLVGCTVGPNYKRPQVPPAPTFRGADGAEVATTNKASLGDENWAEVFREPSCRISSEPR